MSKLNELMGKFEKFVDIARGKKDIKQRISVITNPDNKKTMSVLTREEAHFLAVADFVTGSQYWGLMFEPMQRLAMSRLEPNISIEGKGREQAIQFTQALSESKSSIKIEGAKESKSD